MQKKITLDCSIKRWQKRDAKKTSSWHQCDRIVICDASAIMTLALLSIWCASSYRAARLVIDRKFAVIVQFYFVHLFWVWFCLGWLFVHLALIKTASSLSRPCPRQICAGNIDVYVWRGSIMLALSPQQTTTTRTHKIESMFANVPHFASCTSFYNYNRSACAFLT